MSLEDGGCESVTPKYAKESIGFTLVKTDWVIRLFFKSGFVLPTCLFLRGEVWHGRWILILPFKLLHRTPPLNILHLHISLENYLHCGCLLLDAPNIKYIPQKTMFPKSKLCHKNSTSHSLVENRLKRRKNKPTQIHTCRNTLTHARTHTHNHHHHFLVHCKCKFSNGNFRPSHTTLHQSPSTPSYHRATKNKK